MKKVLKNMIIPVVVTVVVIFIFFRDITLADIGGNFMRIPVAYLLLFILLSLLGTWLRAVKYHLLLSKKLAFHDVFFITLVRNFSVDLLPARTASLVLYTYLANRKGLSVEEGAASFVVSVFYDGLALCAMLGGLLFFLEAGIERMAIYVGMAIIFFLSTVIVFFADTILRALLKLDLLVKIPRVEKFFRNIYSYLVAHSQYSERLTVFVLSLFIRVIKYIYFFILFEGITGIGFSLHHFSLFSFGLAGTELSSLLPIQGLGGFGTWELAFSMVFNALAIPATNLKEAGFVIHITTQVWEYSIGIAAFIYLYFKKGAEPGK